MIVNQLEVKDTAVQYGNVGPLLVKVTSSKTEYMYHTRYSTGTFVILGLAMDVLVRSYCISNYIPRNTTIDSTELHVPVQVPGTVCTLQLYDTLYMYVHIHTWVPTY